MVHTRASKSSSKSLPQSLNGSSQSAYQSQKRQAKNASPNLHKRPRRGPVITTAVQDPEPSPPNAAPATFIHHSYPSPPAPHTLSDAENGASNSEDCCLDQDEEENDLELTVDNYDELTQDWPIGRVRLALAQNRDSNLTAVPRAFQDEARRIQRQYQRRLAALALAARVSEFTMKKSM